MKHTPGPWVSGFVESGWGLVSKPSGTCVVFAERGDGGTIPSEADARLIAVAPDLLGELRIQLISVGCGGETHRCHRCASAKHIISKAEGTEK